MYGRISFINDESMRIENNKQEPRTVNRVSFPWIATELVTEPLSHPFKRRVWNLYEILRERPMALQFSRNLGTLG